MPRILLLCLLLAACLPAAELGWVGAPGTTPPPGWTVQAGGEATFDFRADELVLTSPTVSPALAVAAINVADGTDTNPLRLSAVVAAQGERPLDAQPALIALEWGGGAVFAVGLGRDPRNRTDDRRAWALWSGQGATGAVYAESELAADASPTHLRIVLTAQEVAAYGSRDGWMWTRIAGQPRSRLAATGAPARVVVGRARLRQGASGFASEPLGEGKGRTATYRFARLRLEHDAAEVPAMLLRTYAKRDSLPDTVAALAAAGQPRAWRLRGPEPSSVMPVELPADHLTGDGWTKHQMGESERILQLSQLLPGEGDGVRWAATEIAVAEPGWVRIAFDGTRRCWLWVAGRLASAPERDTYEAEPDRQAVLVWLPPGTHQVVLATRSNREAAVATLRWEPGDPRWRIGVLRRLMIDFPGDEELDDAAFEVARLWEGLGFAREAAASLDEMVAHGPGELAERARAERARLHHQLGDHAAADAEIAALRQLWEADNADAVATVQRTARLWQRLDATDRALAVLAEAMAQPGLDPGTRSHLAVERARLRHRQGDESGAAAELRAAAGFLPSSDELRFALLCAALRRDPRADRAAAEALAKEAVDEQAARLLAGVHAARGDEPARLAARRLAATRPPGRLANATVELAEDLADVDPASAAKLYQQELARRKLDGGGDLAAQRLRLLRAVLAERPAGAELLAQADRLPPEARARPLAWKVLGPVKTHAWKAHETPAFDPAKGAAGPVDGKPWRDVPPEAWRSGVLDLTALGGSPYQIMYLATVLDSAQEVKQVAGFGADDGLTVWMNGQRLFSDRARRQLQPDAIMLPLSLRKGANHLVCSVANDSGTTAFQFSLRREPWPATQAAAILAEAGGASRPSAAAALGGLAAALLATGETDAATALARAVITCFPDQVAVQLRSARALLSDPAWTLSPGDMLEVAAWCDAMLADRRWDDADLAGLARELLPDRLVERGLPEQAFARLRRTAASELDAPVVAGAHLRESSLWLGLGFPHRASVAANRAREAAPGDDAVARDAGRRLRAAKARKGVLVSVVTPFEIAGQLRTAERAVETGDFPRAAAEWQAAIEGGRELAVQAGPGRMVGAAAHAVARLRSVGGETLTAWLDRYAERAAAALRRLGPTSTAGELDAIAARWPVAPAAVEALQRAADLHAFTGDWQLALGSARLALRLATGDAARGPLLLRAAEAAARLGDLDQLTPLLAELGKVRSMPNWDGRRLAAGRLADELRALLPPAPAAIEPRATALVVDLPRYAPAMRPEIAPVAVPPAPGVAQAGGLLLIATPDELAAFAADGSLAWRLADPRLPGRRAPWPIEATSTAMLAAAGDIVVAGLRRAGSRRLCAVETGTGRLRWSSLDRLELSDAALATAPLLADGRVWAWFIAPSRSFMACLDAADGAVLWTTTLGAGATVQPLAGSEELVTAGAGPAPVLSGRELFVSTDAGQIAAFDAMDGRLLWLHAYPRAAFDPGQARLAQQRLLARAAGRVLVDGQRIFVAPRDTLGIIALERGSGALAWSNELADVRELGALTSEGLLALGSQVVCHDPADGAVRWRSSRQAGEPLGPPAIAGGVAWFATAEGLTRINLAQGSAALGPRWKGLGLTRAAPTTLALADGRLLAAGDGVVAILSEQGGAARAALVRRPVVLVEPGVEAAGAAKPAALAVRWRLQLGHVRFLQAADDDQVLAVADGQLVRLSGRDGAVAWSVPAPARRITGIERAGGAVLVASDGQVAAYAWADGQPLWHHLNRANPIVALGKEAWRLQSTPAGDTTVQWWFGWSGWSLVGTMDGVRRGGGSTSGSIIGLTVRGDEVHLAVARRGVVAMEVRQARDGMLVHESTTGFNIDWGPHFQPLGDGDMLVGSGQGNWLWRAKERMLAKSDLGLGGITGTRRDGKRWLVFGYRDRRGAVATISPDGQRQWINDLHPQGGLAAQLRLAERWAGDICLRISGRKNNEGILGLRSDGSEVFWLDGGERQRRSYHCVVPLGKGAVALVIERDGSLRAEYIELPSGARICTSPVPGRPAGELLPVASAGHLLVPTEQGVVALVPAAKAAASDPAEPIEVARASDALRLDGLLGEWPAPVGDQVQVASQWTDEGVAVALRISGPPRVAERVLLAIDPMHQDKVGAIPFLLELAWRDGRTAHQVLSTPLSHDGERPPLRLRAAAGPEALTWEVLIPWIWLYSGRPRLPNNIAMAAVALGSDPAAAPATFADGLLGGLDATGFRRFRLVDAKPDGKKRGK